MATCFQLQGIAQIVELSYRSSAAYGLPFIMTGQKLWETDITIDDR